jgi:hypothetical protein
MGSDLSGGEAGKSRVFIKMFTDWAYWIRQYVIWFKVKK